MPAKLNKLQVIYDIAIILLSIATIILLTLEITQDLSDEQTRLFDLIDTFILVIFIIDYFIRLVLTKEKWKFVKSNIPDLLSIIPFNQIFQALRIFRVFRIVKLIKLTKIGKAARVVSLFAKFSSRASEFIRTNNFIYIAYITGGAVLMGTIGISYAENLNFGNALWWSIVTTTTVGYGDISPKTALGKFIAVILMIVGIGFLGMLTGTISTYFIKRANRKPRIDHQNALSLEGLDEDDIMSVTSYIEYLRTKAK